MRVELTVCLCAASLPQSTGACASISSPCVDFTGESRRLLSQIDALRPGESDSVDWPDDSQPDVYTCEPYLDAADDIDEADVDGARTRFLGARTRMCDEQQCTAW